MLDLCGNGKTTNIRDTARGGSSFTTNRNPKRSVSWWALPREWHEHGALSYAGYGTLTYMSANIPGATGQAAFADGETGAQVIAYSRI